MTEKKPYRFLSGNPLSLPPKIAAGSTAQSFAAQGWQVAPKNSQTGVVVTNVTPNWSWSDYGGAVLARSSGFRMRYTVAPGLYAIGEPDGNSEVFVSANYKLSFDLLRKSLAGIHGWILVLDTKGINVWCAAGKGTFGTRELINRIGSVQLSSFVDHNRIIVPQLGAPGVNADQVRKESGFRVCYGPVRAQDIPTYLAQGRQATAEMRRIRFDLSDRLVLIPIELNQVVQKIHWYIIILFAVAGLGPEGILFNAAIRDGLPWLFLGFAALAAGTILTPALLPWIPFRSFALKGWLAGFGAVLATGYGLGFFERGQWLFLVLALIFFPMLASYLALQFTGATTYTSMSGVEKEIRIAQPVYLFAKVAAIVTVLAVKLIQWGIL